MSYGLFGPPSHTQRRVMDAMPAAQPRPMAQADAEHFEAALREVGEAFGTPPPPRPAIPPRPQNTLLGRGSIFDAPEGAIDDEGASCD